MQSVKAALNRTWSQRCPCAHGSFDALEVLRSKVLNFEQVTQELPSVLGNDHLVWVRNPLQTRCKVRRLADDGLLLGRARTYQITNDYQTRGDAYPRLESRADLQIANSGYKFE